MSGPAGAIFEPESYDVDLSQEGARCDGSYKFELVGFGIESRVVVKPASSTAAAVPFRCDDSKACQLEVALIAGGSGEQVAVTSTRPDGSFKFLRVAPGKYTLQALPKQGISFSVPSVECEVRLGASRDCSKQQLAVGGFVLRGRAVSYDEPLEGVAVALLERASGSALQETVTDGRGEYVFENVAPGKYLLNATVGETETKFKIERSVLEAEVKNGITEVEEPFVVAGFSIRGKVINTRGYGIKDVIVKIDGERKATTNDRGYYKLDEIVPGDYILEGLHDSYLFEPMKIRIDPHSGTIPELVVSEYKLCGKILVNDSGFNTDGRSVILKDKQGHQERITAVDKSGMFCFDVKPLEYVIRPVISNEEYETGLRFKPSKIDVEVKDKPVTNLAFEQIKYQIQGTINCKHEGKCEGIEVILRNERTNYSDSLKYSGSSFTFDGLLPGNYTVQVNKPEYCWGNSDNGQDGSVQSVIVGEEVGSSFLVYG